MKLFWTRRDQRRLRTSTRTDRGWPKLSQHWRSSSRQPVCLVSFFAFFLSFLCRKSLISQGWIELSEANPETDCFDLPLAQWSSCHSYTECSLFFPLNCYSFLSWVFLIVCSCFQLVCQVDLVNAGGQTDTSLKAGLLLLMPDPLSFTSMRSKPLFTCSQWKMTNNAIIRVKSKKDQWSKREEGGGGRVFHFNPIKTIVHLQPMKDDQQCHNKS